MLGLQTIDEGFGFFGRRYARNRRYETRPLDDHFGAVFLARREIRNRIGICHVKFTQSLCYSNDMPG